MDYHELDGLIDSLKGELHSVLSADRKDWKGIREDIREIGSSFKEVRYPARSDKDDAWDRFQTIVQEIKSAQDEDRQCSTNHRNEIVSKANQALQGMSAIAHAIGGLAHMIASTHSPFLTGDYDSTRADLENSSKELKHAWDHFNDVKGEMLGRDKHEAFKALMSCREQLDESWNNFKEAQHQAYEARQRRREERKEKIEANLRKNRDYLDDLERRKDKIKQNIDNNRDRLDDARHDDYRSMVEGWIDQGEDDLREVEEKINRVERWIDEDEENLSNLR